MSKPGNASASAGTLSAPGSLAVLIIAMARSRPALAWAIPAAALTTPSGTWPLITSGTICAAPRYGMCRTKVPVFAFIISKQR
jgi:hypothetical protein